MTTPTERSTAVLQAERFLRRLLDSKETPRVPRELREEAAALLRHYPTYFDLAISCRHAPFVWGPVPRPPDAISEWEIGE